MMGRKTYSLCIRHFSINVSVALFTYNLFWLPIIFWVRQIFLDPNKKDSHFFFNIQDVKCACDDGGLVHPWDCCSVGDCNVFCCNCGGPCRNNETSLEKADFAMFEEQRSKRSVMTIDPEEYNVSYNEYSTEYRGVITVFFRWDTGYLVSIICPTASGWDRVNVSECLGKTDVLPLHWLRPCSIVVRLWSF